MAQREIKFRAWNKERQEMVYNTERHTVWAGGRCASINGDDIYNKFLSIDYKDVMQFTGLIDKNGREIYEGDICQKDGLKQSITFAYGTFLWGSNALWNSLYKELEIIGNIYENPELSGEQQC